MLLLWTPFTRCCRGIVFDTLGNLLTFPFHKFFNFGETEETRNLPLNQPYEVAEKVDGVLGILYLFKRRTLFTKKVVGRRLVRSSRVFRGVKNACKIGALMLAKTSYYEPKPSPKNFVIKSEGEISISTRGAFHSVFTEAANEILSRDTQAQRRALKEVISEWTLMAEIIHPKSRIVVDYGGKKALMLVGARHRQTHQLASFSELQRMGKDKRIGLEAVPFHPTLDL